MPARLLALLLGVGLLTLSACGGSGEESSYSSGEVDDDFARYSGADVALHFKSLTGVDLQLEAQSADGGPGTEGLRLPSASGTERLTAARRYGAFSIYVTKNKQNLNMLKQRSGRRQEVVGNVVLDSYEFGDPEAERAFRRTAAIVGSLGTPPEQVRLSPEETPCRKARIDPGGAGVKEGTCKLGQQTLTIVNNDGRLETPGQVISDVEVKTGDSIVARRFGRTQRVRARGGFVLVTLRLENTGDEPITARDPTLVVGGKRYTADPTKQTYLPVINPYTIQPGAFETVAFLYDIPVPAARRGGSDGALEVSADAMEAPVNTSSALGRIRLTEDLPPPRGSIS